MARPLTRAQTLQNRAFLRVLRQGGNVRAAARAIDAVYSTMMHRRGAHPGFALEWDAAVASAQARLNDRGGVRGPEARAGAAGGEANPRAHRTVGGEPVVVRTRGGRIQVRAAHPDKLTTQCEQAFLLALSATANIRLSAAAAGASPAAFSRRKRRNPGFAREMRIALEQGYARIEAALLAGFAPDAHADDAWRHNEPPPIPPMTAAQALQLMYLHQKEARLLAEPAHVKRRRGESREAHSVRLSAMYEARLERDREAFRVAEAGRAARGEAPYWGEDAAGAEWADPHEPPRPELPDLAQVTGCSTADPANATDTDGGKPALFGGWRIEDMRRKMGEGEATPPATPQS